MSTTRDTIEKVVLDNAPDFARAVMAGQLRTATFALANSITAAIEPSEPVAHGDDPQFNTALCVKCLAPGRAEGLLCLFCEDGEG